MHSSVIYNDTLPTLLMFTFKGFNHSLRNKLGYISFKRAISRINVEEIKEYCSEGVKTPPRNVDQADGSYWPVEIHIQSQKLLLNHEVLLWPFVL